MLRRTVKMYVTHGSSLTPFHNVTLFPVLLSAVNAKLWESLIAVVFPLSRMQFPATGIHLGEPSGVLMEASIAGFGRRPPSYRSIEDCLLPS